MRVEGLDPARLARALARRGLGLQIGPFQVRVRSPLPEVARGIAHLYAHHRLIAASIPDFEVAVQPGTALRRWLAPQARFTLDGHDPFKPLPRAHAFPLLEWGLNWCVASYAHQYLILHAAVVARGDSALVLAAPPGSGKSTLCAALATRGWRLFSDELALLRVGSDEVHPLARPISLKNASIDLLRRWAPAARFSDPVADTHKGTIAHLSPSGDCVREAAPARVRWCLFPRYSPGAVARLEPAPKGAAFLEAAQQAFNYSVLGVHGFDTLRTMMAAAGCYRFAFDDLAAAVATLDRLADDAHA